MYCIKCGTKNNDSDLFFYQCGQQIDNNLGNKIEFEKTNSTDSKDERIDIITIRKKLRHQFESLKNNKKLMMIFIGSLFLLISIISFSLFIPKYRSASFFSSNGLAQVWEWNFINRTNEFGFINEKGKYVLTPQFAFARDFASNGLAPVLSTEGKWGYIDESGEYVITPQFDDVKSFSEYGLAFVCVDYKWGCINGNGEYVITPQFDEVPGDFSNNGLASLYSHEGEGKFGYIDENGEYVIKPQFDDVKNFSNNGLAPVLSTEGKWGYIDERGEYVIIPQFDDASIFSSNGLAFVVDEGEKNGYINENGEYVIILSHECVGYNFSNNGLARVYIPGDTGDTNDRKWGYIDKSGEYVITPQFDDAGDFSDNGLAMVKVGLKYGYIDENGEYVIIPK